MSNGSLLGAELFVDIRICGFNINCCLIWVFLLPEMQIAHHEFSPGLTEVLLLEKAEQYS